MAIALGDLGKYARLGGTWRTMVTSYRQRVEFETLLAPRQEHSNSFDKPSSRRAAAVSEMTASR